MAAYARKYKLNFPLLKDPGGKVSRQLLFSVTPEVRVYDSTGKLAYSGRIDNRYRVNGGRPGDTNTPELANALEAVLAGKPVAGSKTKPVGCPLQVAAAKDTRGPIGGRPSSSTHRDQAQHRVVVASLAAITSKCQIA